jgi:hypothetical protein
MICVVPTTSVAEIDLVLEEVTKMKDKLCIAETRVTAYNVSNKHTKDFSIAKLPFLW